VRQAVNGSSDASKFLRGERLPRLPSPFCRYLHRRRPESGVREKGRGRVLARCLAARRRRAIFPVASEPPFLASADPDVVGIHR